MPICSTVSPFPFKNMICKDISKDRWRRKGEEEEEGEEEKREEEKEGEGRRSCGGRRWGGGRRTWA